MDLTNKEKELITTMAIKDAAKTLASTFITLGNTEPIETVVAEEKTKSAFRLTFERITYEQAMIERKIAEENGTPIHDDSKKSRGAH